MRLRRIRSRLIEAFAAPAAWRRAVKARASVVVFDISRRCVKKGVRCFANRSVTTRNERRRLVVLVRTGHGRPSRLRAAERDELAELVARLEPRLLAGEAVNRISPVPLPKRIVRGRRR